MQLNKFARQSTIVDSSIGNTTLGSDFEDNRDYFKGVISSPDRKSSNKPPVRRSGYKSGTSDEDTFREKRPHSGDKPDKHYQYLQK